MDYSTVSGKEMISDLTSDKVMKTIKELTQTEEVNRLRNWYSDFITLFRKEYEKLTDEEKKGILNSRNFLHPCQVEVFWIKNPSQQLIVQSNFAERPDMEIIIHGPYDTHDFSSNVRPVFMEPRWQKRIDRIYPMNSYYAKETYAEELASSMRRFIEFFKVGLFQTKRSDEYSMGMSSSGSMWFQQFVGNIANLDIKSEVSRIIEEVKNQSIRIKESAKNPPAPATTTEIKYDGYGVHLFPPIFLGKKTKKTWEQLLQGIDYDFSFNEKVLDEEINGHVVVLNKDGYIFIKINQKNDGIKILNLIMAIGFFHDLPLFAVKEHELSQAQLTDQNAIGGMTWNPESVRSYLFDESFGRQGIERYHKREIEKEKITNILNDVKIIIPYEKLSEELRLFNEANTHLANSEYAQSFVMSWSVIERHYSDVWRKKLDKKDVDEERLSKLTNSAQWSIDFVLEVLNLGGDMEDNAYDLLMDLKRKRNQFYHRGKQVTKEDAERCLSFSQNILVSKIADAKKGLPD